MRYYLGVDWADREHAVWVEDQHGTKNWAQTVAHTPEALSEWGRWLDEQRAAGITVWAGIERPDGVVVDFLLDHGVLVYPINPKALNRVRDRYRMSGAKSDPWDAQVAAGFVRTDHARLRPLQPSSAPRRPRQGAPGHGAAGATRDHARGRGDLSRGHRRFFRTAAGG